MINRFCTLGDILAHNHLLELVLERFDIRWCAPHETLECISRENGCSVDFLVEILNLFDKEVPYPSDTLQQHPLPVVIDYLERTHRYYLDKRLFELERIIQLIIREGTGRHRLCSQLKIFFEEFKTGLWEHIELEENYLFPHVRFLMSCAAAVKNSKWLQHKFRNFSVHQFMAEHDDDSETRLSVIQQIVAANIGYTTQFSLIEVFLRQVQAFEKDLRIHALVEDEVLIPRALQMECELGLFL